MKDDGELQRLENKWLQKCNKKEAAIAQLAKEYFYGLFGILAITMVLLIIVVLLSAVVTARRKSANIVN